MMGLKNRYDVTVLVNGLPARTRGLKRRGVDLKEAFNQITAVTASRSGRVPDF